MAYSQEIARSLLSGPLADMPLASVGRYWYFADDEDGGTLYKSDGSTWRQVSGAVTGGGGSPTGSAGGVLDGTYPNPGLAAGVAGNGLTETSDVLSVNVDGSTLEINTDALRVKALGITDAHVALANKDGTTSTPSMRTLGTGASQAAAGNDSRLSDSRAPSGSAGGVLDGTYPNPGLAAGVAGAGLAETSDVLSVNVDGTTIEINVDTLRVKSGVYDAAGAAAAAQAASQPLDSDLTAIAALTPTNDDIVQRKAGAWTNRSIAQLLTDLAAPGTTFQALDATLTALAGLATGANQVPYSTGTDTFSQLGTNQLTGAPAGTFWTIVAKGGDTSRSTTTTATADPDLAFTGASGGAYEIVVFLLYGSPLGAGTPDIKIGVGEDATARGALQSRAISTSDAAVTATFLTNQGAPWTAGTAAANRVWYAQGAHVSNGASFQVLWAQNTSDSNATIVRAGSLIAYRRIV